MTRRELEPGPKPAVDFTIPGIPVPQARSRHRIIRMGNGKQFVGQYDPAACRSWKATVADFAARAMEGRPPMASVPLTVEMVFSFLPPASTPKYIGKMIAEGVEMAKLTRPDLDNLVKGVLDGCTGIVWRDDGQVYCYGRTRKVYGRRAEVRVSVKGE